MQVVSDLQCLPDRCHAGQFFDNVLYQRRLRSISQFMFRNIVFPDPNWTSRLTVCIKTVTGTTLHDSHELDLRSNFIYRYFTLSGAGYDSFLSTKIFIVELLIDSKVVHSWKVNTSELMFIGSVNSGGDDSFDSKSHQVGTSMHLLSNVLFGSNSLICVFNNDAFYCSPDFISNLGAFPNSAVYPKLEPPLLQDLQVNKSSKAWVLDEDKLREIHSNSLIVLQKRRERSTILNEVNRLDDVSSKIQAKLQRLEYLTQKVATMNTERTRLMCENENFRLTIQEKTKHSIETDSGIKSLQSQKEDSIKQVETLRAKLEERYQECSLVRKKKQIVQGYLLQELQSVFSITEKSHSPLDLKSGKFGAFLFNKISSRSNTNLPNGSPSHPNSGNRKELIDTQWYICGIWLPKSGVFDPGYQQQVLAAAQGQSSTNQIANRSIDASKVDDFEIVTAVCYVAWVLVLMSQITGTILRYQIDIKSPTRWFVHDNQIELREYRDNREYELANDRKLRVKDDFRFLHALFCINKNIGQLRYKLNLGFSSRDSFTIHRTLRDLNMVLRSLSNKKRLLTTYQKILSFSDLTKLDFSKAGRSDKVPIAISDGHPRKLLSQHSLAGMSPPTIVEYQVPSQNKSSSSAESPRSGNNNNYDNLNDDLEKMFEAAPSTKSFLVGENGHSGDGASRTEKGDSLRQLSYNINVGGENAVVANVSFTGIITNGRDFEQEGEDDSSSSEEERDREEEEEVLSRTASAASDSRRRFTAMKGSLSRASGTTTIQLIE